MKEKEQTKKGPQLGWMPIPFTVVLMLIIGLFLGWRMLIGCVSSVDINVLVTGTHHLSDFGLPPKESARFGSVPTGLYVANLEMTDTPCVVKLQRFYMVNTRIGPGELKYRTYQQWILEDPGEHEIRVSPNYVGNFTLSNSCPLEWVPP